MISRHDPSPALRPVDRPLARKAPVERTDLLVCGECDAVYARRPIASRDMQRCRRCGATIDRGHWLGVQGQVALTLTALIVFVIASLSPIVTLELSGQHSVATLGQAIRATWDADEPLLALLAVATAAVFPLLVIVLRLWVLVPIWRRRQWPGFVVAMRLLRWMLRWSMVEVFMLAVLVAVVRSAGISTVVPGAGIFAYGALVVLLAAIQSTGLHGLWRLAEVRRS